MIRNLAFTHCSLIAVLLCTQIGITQDREQEVILYDEFLIAAEDVQPELRLEFVPIPESQIPILGDALAQSTAAERVRFGDQLTSAFTFNFIQQTAGVSDNQQDIDPEWFGKTQKNTSIMSKVFDKVLSDALGESYQTGGFIHKGCQGFWIPNTGLLFQLQVNFPLEEKTEKQMQFQESQPDTDDLWNQVENQLSGTPNTITLKPKENKRETLNADRTEELQDLIIDTIAKYGSKFEGMRENDRIIVMIQSPVHKQPILSFETVDLSMDFPIADDLYSTAKEDYQTQIVKHQNALNSYRSQLADVNEYLAILSQKKEAGVLQQAGIKDEYEYKQKQREIERKIKDITLDLSNITSKMNSLQQQNNRIHDDILLAEEAKTEAQRRLEVQRQHESFIEEKISAQLDVLVGKNNYVVEVTAILDWETDDVPGIADTGYSPNELNGNTEYNETVANNRHPWLETFSNKDHYKITDINIAVIFNHHFNEQDVLVPWSPDELKKFEELLRTAAGLPDTSNANLPIKFVMQSHRFDDTKVRQLKQQKLLSNFRQFVPSENRTRLPNTVTTILDPANPIQPAGKGKSMIMQVPFHVIEEAETLPQRTFFKADGEEQKEQQIKEHIRSQTQITIY